jgi:hypothetical protein
MFRLVLSWTILISNSPPRILCSESQLAKPPLNTVVVAVVASRTISWWMDLPSGLLEYILLSLGDRSFAKQVSFLVAPRNPHHHCSIALG